MKYYKIIIVKITKKSDFNNIIQSYLIKGEIVPVDITVKLLKNEMELNGWEVIIIIQFINRKTFI